MARSWLGVLLGLLAAGIATAAVGAGKSGGAAEATTAGTVRALRTGLAHVGYTTGAGDAVELRWLGSGFLVDRRCTVATAKHLLREVPADRLLVRFENPAAPLTALTFNARLAWADPDRDVAYLSVAELPGGGNPCAAAGLSPLKLVERIDPEALGGAEVLILGFPALEGEQPREVPIVRRGFVASAELSWDGRTMLLLDMTGIPGFSGAPVALRETGEVVGIVFGPGRTRREFDLEWATPLVRADLKRSRPD